MDTRKLVLNVTLEAHTGGAGPARPGHRVASRSRSRPSTASPGSRRTASSWTPPLPAGSSPSTSTTTRRTSSASSSTEVAKARRGRTGRHPYREVPADGRHLAHDGAGALHPEHWRNFQALNISRKEQKVDDGGQNSTPDSLHGKIRFMYERLPGEETFRLEIRHLSLVNPVLGGQPSSGRRPTPTPGGAAPSSTVSGTRPPPPSTAAPSRPPSPRRCAVPIYLSTPQGTEQRLRLAAGAPTPCSRSATTGAQHPRERDGTSTSAPEGSRHPGALAALRGWGVAQPLV